MLNFKGKPSGHIFQRPGWDLYYKLFTAVTCHIVISWSVCHFHSHLPSSYFADIQVLKKSFVTGTNPIKLFPSYFSNESNKLERLPIPFASAIVLFDRHTSSQKSFVSGTNPIKLIFQMSQIS
jgi:hypothetical protein